MLHHSKPFAGDNKISKPFFSRPVRWDCKISHSVTDDLSQHASVPRREKKAENTHLQYIGCSFGFTHSYLLVKSLSPVKDLEQPLSISFSSSVLIGGLEEKTGNGRAGEVEGKGDSEEEEAELSSPSPALGFSEHSPSSSTPSPAGAPQQSERPGPSVKSIHAPRSLSMTRLFSVSLRSCLFTSWTTYQNLKCLLKRSPKKIPLYGANNPKGGISMFHRKLLKK